MMETVHLPCATSAFGGQATQTFAERRNQRCRSKPAGEKYIAVSTQNRRTGGKTPLSALPIYQESEQKASTSSGEGL
jgi:hypothetical protein